MTILEHDPVLHALIERCLLGDNVSAARDQPDSKMLSGMLRSLRTAQVGELHPCGDVDCHSFETTNHPPVGGDLYAIRFIVHGELTIECDATGKFCSIEYLPDEANPTAKCYERTAEGWVIRYVTAYSAS